VHLRELRKLVKIPSKVMLKMLKIEQVERTLRNELGREPTTEEIVIRSNIPIKVVRELHIVRLSELSIDAPIGYDRRSDGVSLGDSIADPHADMLSERALSDFDRLPLLKAIDALTDRERAVIVARFGLWGHDVETLEEIGKRWKITKEAIWNTEIRALAKLRRLLVSRSVCA
jgi:RNA polymerase primary sigma factor